MKLLNNAHSGTVIQRLSSSRGCPFQEAVTELVLYREVKYIVSFTHSVL